MVHLYENGVAAARLDVRRTLVQVGLGSALKGRYVNFSKFEQKLVI